MELKKIDLALELMGEFAKLTHGTVAQINKMRESVIFKDSTVPAKFKTLGALLWAINAKCEPCIKFYVNKAVSHGTTEQELGDFLAIASTMGGCVGEMWAIKAYKSYKDVLIGKVSADDPSCCV